MSSQRQQIVVPANGAGVSVSGTWSVQPGGDSRASSRRLVSLAGSYAQPRLLQQSGALQSLCAPHDSALAPLALAWTAVDYTKLLPGDALLVCAALLGAAPAQAPGQRGARAPAPVKHDTIYVAVQSPPPSVTVEAPSDTPTIVLGFAGALLLLAQLWIMKRQTEAMDKQTTLLAKQTALEEQQAAWRRDEALGTLYRMAFDLAEEFRKANVGIFDSIPANYDTHPRQVLRQASAVFAPLGNAFVMAVNQAGMRLDEYFLAVERYNRPFRQQARRDGDVSVDNQADYTSVQSIRGIIGGDLDLANHQIPPELRWKYSDGRDYSFRSMCSQPPPMRDSRE